MSLTFTVPPDISTSSISPPSAWSVLLNCEIMSSTVSSSSITPVYSKVICGGWKIYVSMTDIALLWDTNLLFEKFFVEHGFSYQLVHPASLGSPFLPKFKLAIIPTGFANPQYSGLLPYLVQNRQNIDDFVKSGGILLVYGALSESHDYDWLPVKLEYVRQYGPVELSERCRSDVSLLAGDTSQECDGFFCSADGECVLVNDKGETVLVEVEHGQGLIIATTIHEFPTPEFVMWALEHSKPAGL